MQFYRINFSSRKVVPFNSPTFCRGTSNGHRKFVAIESGLSAFGKRINRFPIPSFVVASRTHSRNAHRPFALRPPRVADRFVSARSRPCRPASAPFRSDRRVRLDCRRRNLEMKMISVVVVYIHALGNGWVGVCTYYFGEQNWYITKDRVRWDRCGMRRKITLRYVCIQWKIEYFSIPV